MAGNNNESENRVEAKLDGRAAPEANTGRTPARLEAVKMLNSTDSLPIFEENAWQNSGDPLQPLALMDHDQNVAAEEHHGHSHGKHGHPHSGDATATATATTDTSGQNLLVKESMLATSNPEMAIQLAASNPQMAMELAALNPGAAIQLAAMNPGMAAQLAASNPAFAAQLRAQNPTLAKELGIPSPNDQQNV
jgi:hypothetical protein